MRYPRAKERMARVTRAVAHLSVEEVKRRLNLDPRPSYPAASCLRSALRFSTPSCRRRSDASTCASSTIRKSMSRHDKTESSWHARREWLYSRQRSGDVLRDTRQRSATGAAARQSLGHWHLVRQGAAEAFLDAADYRRRAAGTWAHSRH